MNYRHAYHAGNFADVFKHAIVIGLLEALKCKPKPLCYIETHAGRGYYDLGGDEAGKTQEAADGIARLLHATQLPATLNRYLNLVRSLREPHDAAETSVMRDAHATRSVHVMRAQGAAAPRQPACSVRTLRGDGGTAAYPGSPLLAQCSLREGDEAIVCELQPQEAAALRTLFRDQPQVHVHARDGYEALPALVPPAQKRGLVLIDPPYEHADQEFRRIRHALEQSRTRWPSGCYAVWYPIKLRAPVEPFKRWLRRCDDATVLNAELLLHPDNSNLRLNGAGMAIINPPWRFERELEDLLASLVQHLAQSRYGTCHVEWLAGRPNG